MEMVRLMNSLNQSVKSRACSTQQWMVLEQVVPPEYSHISLVILVSSPSDLTLESQKSEWEEKHAKQNPLLFSLRYF